MKGAGMGTARIEHIDPDCVGLWLFDYPATYWAQVDAFETDAEAKYPTVVCSGCHARFRMTVNVRRLAESENYRGFLLAQLTRQGAELIP